MSGKPNKKVPIHKRDESYALLYKVDRETLEPLGRRQEFRKAKKVESDDAESLSGQAAGLEIDPSSDESDKKSRSKSKKERSDK